MNAKLWYLVASMDGVEIFTGMFCADHKKMADDHVETLKPDIESQHGRGRSGKLETKLYRLTDWIEEQFLNTENLNDHGAPRTDEDD